MKIETYSLKLKDCPDCIEYIIRAPDRKTAKLKASAFLKDVSNYELTIKKQ